jgi:NADH:ubiquinone oxidoreductase subunit K
MTATLAATRSELTRLRRKGFTLGWLGLTFVLTLMISTFSFVVAGDGTDVSAAPGGGFPTAAELSGADGRMLPLGAAATILGVVTLSFWAVATASDYVTGLIRLLVQAQPGRARLLMGKVLALIGWTALVTTIATVAVLFSGPVVAEGTGVSTAAWSTDPATVAGQVLGSWLNTFLALVVWGVIGLVIAVLAKSSAVAISVGLGYVLVIEGLLRAIAPDVADWLPGATLTALAKGGTSTTSYAAALGLGFAYAAIGLIVAVLVFRRRDVTD